MSEYKENLKKEIEEIRKNNYPKKHFIQTLKEAELKGYETCEKEYQALLKIAQHKLINEHNDFIIQVIKTKDKEFADWLENLQIQPVSFEMAMKLNVKTQYQQIEDKIKELRQTK